MIKNRIKKIGSFLPININNVHKGQGTRIILLLFMFVFLSSSLTLAETIWRIGIEDRSADEYEHPQSDPNLDQEIVNYRVPQGWNTGAANWRSFPCKIWPSEAEAEFKPKEIHITYEYPKDYRNVKLRIVAKTIYHFTQRLIVERQDDPVYPNEGFQLIAQFALFEFTLGDIKKGLQEENRIIIKNQPVSENYSIYFDYLELVDQDQDQNGDTDGDGSLDPEEIEGDTDGDGSSDSEEIKGDTDGDGYENSEDRDTVSLIIQGYDDTSIKKNITLDIEEGVDSNTYFTGIVFMDTNSPGFPPGLPGDLFFPFCFFKAGIRIPADKDRVDIQILYPEDETIHSTAQFYISKDCGDWERIPAEIIDENILRISIEANNSYDANNSGDSGEISPQEEGMMAITGGLAYPQGVGIDLNESKCFVDSLIL